MDPDANMGEQLALALGILRDEETEGQDVMRLAELVLALDDWLKKGGAFPVRWTHNRKDHRA